MRSIIVICFCFLVGYSMGQDSLHVQRPNVSYYDDPNPFLENFTHIDDFQEAVIYNRWGNLVFRSTKVNFNWNGRNQKTNELLQKGTYTILIKTKSTSFTMHTTLLDHYCSG